MLPSHFQFYFYNRSTLKSEMYDNFLEVRNYGKLSAKFLLGTSVVIEKVRLMLCFWFLARTTIRIQFIHQAIAVLVSNLIWFGMAVARPTN